MRLLQTFYSDRQGNVAIIAAILVLPMLMLAGVGIEYSRISSAEKNLQTTVDNAALDAARLFRLGPRAEQELAAFINANSGRNTAQVRIRVHRDKLRIDARDEIDTPLLSTIGEPKSEITASIEVDGNTSTGTQRDAGQQSKPKPDNKSNTKQIARLRKIETRLRQNLDQVRKAGSRLPIQTSQRLERKLREQIREVRRKIRQLQTA
ncbi:MAG: TadE/TadG family type IV pilus assembly protein [Pseudomonadota bacterium]